jgi:hypothetical protein
MSQEPSAQIGRRRLLAGALGALGGWVASAVALPGVAQAANGTPVTVGNSVSGTATTTVTNNSGTSGTAGLKGVGAIGVSGTSTISNGSAAGVYGTSGSGTYGVFSDGKLGTNSVLELRKIGAPGAAPSGRVYLWTRMPGAASSS